MSTRAGPPSTRPTLEEVRARRELARELDARVGLVKSLGASEAEVAAAEERAGRAHVLAELAVLASGGDREAAVLLERLGKAG